MDRTRGTIGALISAGEAAASAIESVDGVVSTYRDTAIVVNRIAGQLRTLGIEANDRVAIIVPNGPGVAFATLGVTSYAAAAPLNPGFRTHELDYHLRNLRPKLIITGSDPSHEIPAVAPIAVLRGDKPDVGLELDGRPVIAAESVAASPDDVALVLHTSGTTSQPKQVALSHRNLVASAVNIAETLHLGPSDRCLNVMPLFHVHGIVGALLASLAAGSSVVCTPGFSATGIRRLLSETEATWSTAVPTMYQLILARAARHSAEPIARLRFLRSSSAPMPPTVITDTENLFGVPLIEAYGMTEASHQIATNPLPPAERRPGSVGLPGATEVRILSDTGSAVPTGQEGEVAIRGDSVIEGYVDNAEANAAAFVDGWFLTGDLGRIDDDGYLYLTGRIKEIINRGGTKISPREVDEVLLRHPGVAEAVSFGVPHGLLGEDVAAAVVADDPGLTEDELRTFAGRFLSSGRVPNVIVFVAEIPKGSTGKVQRRGLAAELGLD